MLLVMSSPQNPDPLRRLMPKPLTVLLTLGAAFAIFGAASGSVPILIVGLLVAVIAALAGDSLEELVLKVPGANLTIRRHSDRRQPDTADAGQASQRGD